jgi:hypothetical protein
MSGSGATQNCRYVSWNFEHIQQLCGTVEFRRMADEALHRTTVSGFSWPNCRGLFVAAKDGNHISLSSSGDPDLPLQSAVATHQA